MGMSPAIPGAAFLIVVSVPFIAHLIRQRSKSRVRVTVDRATSLVRVATVDGRTDIPIRDIEKVDIGSSIQATSDGKFTLYRLEFVRRNQERVPATTEYLHLSAGDREKLLEALNHQLGERNAMLS